MVPIGYHIIGIQHKGFILSLGLICFVVPYILLVAPAGYLADRFSKRTVIAGSMLLQSAILVLGFGALLITNVFLLFFTLALMGAQGALLAPSKGGTIPETIRAESLSRANGIMGMASVMAAVIGSVLGNTLYVLTAPVGKTHWWISAAALISISILGFATALLITKREAADPARSPPKKILTHTVEYLNALKSDRKLLAVASASAFFWFLAALAQVNVYLLGTTALHITQEEVGYLLAILALGVAVGSILAGLWSGDKIDLGITTIGAGGIVFTSIMMFVVVRNGGVGHAMLYWSFFFLFLMGISSGIYEVPLSAYLQYNSPKDSRGKILAGVNFITFSAMLIASLVFWVARSLLGSSAGIIFLIAGLITSIIFLVMLFVLPHQTWRALLRPMKWIAGKLNGVP